MPETLQAIRTTMSRIEQLERQIFLKQLQIKSLSALTQSINQNVSAADLFEKYNSFLRWEMQIKRLALFFEENDDWKCQTHYGIDPNMLNESGLIQAFGAFTKVTALAGNEHPLLSQFDYIVPVLHKDAPVAYALIGELNESEDTFETLQFVNTLTSIVGVAIENKRLFKQQLNREIVNREIELAAEIQQALVPARMPANDRYQFSRIYKPHFAVGGDYYDVVEFPDGKVVFCIADISGKGVPAALLMANFQANFHALASRRPNLEDLVQELNAAVFRVTNGDRYITLFLGKYDPENRTLHYVNAGHTPPFLLMQDCDTIRLTNGCTLIGWLPQLPKIEIGGVCLTKQALLFAYTDGLTDLCNREGENFSEELLENFLLEHKNLSVSDLNWRLLHHIEAFRGDQPYPDDITVLSSLLG